LHKGLKILARRVHGVVVVLPVVAIETIVPVDVLKGEKKRFLKLRKINNEIFSYELLCESELASKVMHCKHRRHKAPDKVKHGHVCESDRRSGETNLELKKKKRKLKRLFLTTYFLPQGHGGRGRQTRHGRNA